MSIKSIFYALAILIIHFSCAPPKYMVITPETTPSERDVKSKRFIFLSDRLVENSGRLAYLINAKKTIDFTKELDHVKDLNTRRFLRSTQNIIEGNYLMAYYDLATIPNSKFDFETQVLLADVLHEMHVDSLNYTKVYQRVVDSTRDENIRSIAIKRHRFLKYEN
jgi:hypothetical protein